MPKVEGTTLTLDDVKEIFHRAKKVKEKLNPEWNIYELLYEGMSIRSSDGSVSKAFSNSIFPNIELILAHMLSNGVTLKYLPTHGASYQHAYTAQQFWDFIAYHNRFKSVAKCSIRNALKFGTGVLRVSYENGIVKIANISPFLMYFTEGEHLRDVYMTFEAQNISHKVARRLYPEIADKIKKGAIWERNLNVPIVPQAPFTKAMYVTDLTGELALAQTDAAHTTFEDDMVSVIKIYTKIGEYKYQPTVFVGDVRVNDPNERATFNPYVLLRPYKRDGLIWGSSKVAKIANKEMLIHKQEEQIATLADNSSGFLAMSKNALEDPNNVFTVQNGLKVLYLNQATTSVANAVLHIKPNLVDANIVTLANQSKAEVANDVGVTPILRGIPPKRLDSGFAFAKMEKTASVWLDEELAEIGLDLQDLGWKVYRMGAVKMREPILSQIMRESPMRLAEVEINTNEINTLNPNLMFNVVAILGSGQEYENSITLETLSILAQAGMQLPQDFIAELFKTPFRQRLLTALTNTQQQTAPTQAQQQTAPPEAEQVLGG